MDNFQFHYICSNRIANWAWKACLSIQTAVERWTSFPLALLWNVRFGWCPAINFHWIFICFSAIPATKPENFGCLVQSLSKHLCELKRDTDLVEFLQMVANDISEDTSVKATAELKVSPHMQTFLRKRFAWNLFSRGYGVKNILRVFKSLSST
jgi:hypothetical protein